MRDAFAALLILLFAAGCASDDEDRAFFNRGWTHPEQGAEQRMNAR